MAKWVVVLSGPENAHARTVAGLENAHLSLLPADHYAIGRQSYAAEHWEGYLTALPSGEEPKDDHGFVAVLADGDDELNGAVEAVEKHGWVLRVHNELPAQPKPDLLRAVFDEYDRRIANLERQLAKPPMRGGAVESPPWATQAGSFPAEQTRRGVFAGFARTAANTPGILAGGLMSASDIQMAAPGSGLSVNVSTGEAIVGGTEGGTQGGYYGRVSSTTNLTIATANGSNPRIDTVCMTVADAAYTIPTGGSSGNVTLQVVTGTATSGATLTNLTGAATLPGSSLLIGYVLVPASATNIVSGDVSSRATTASVFGTSAWTNLTLGSGITSVGPPSGSAYAPQARIVRGDTVQLRGVMQSVSGTSANANWATTPASMKPAQIVGALPLVGYNSTVTIAGALVQTSGDIDMVNSVSAGSTVSLDGFFYSLRI